MSVLAEEIAKVLARRKNGRALRLTVAEVDRLLAALDIPTSASKGVPVSLRATRVLFSGTKRLKPDHPDAVGHEPEEVVDLEDDDDFTADTDDGDGIEDQAAGSEASEVKAAEEKIIRVPVPFEFEWEPQHSVNGIGSGRNLRGKSTVMNVLLWSLTGRCSEFSPDIRRWIEHIEVDWKVGEENLRVSFDAERGVVTSGTVIVVNRDGTEGTVLAEFDNDSFDDAMNSIMLNRLRLEPFTVSQVGTSTTHKWASYVNAFWVRPKYLKSIIGKESTLSVRLMQMFIGTDWVPVLATASTVAGTLAAKQKAATEKAKVATEAVDASRIEAQKTVDDLKARIAALPSGTPDVGRMMHASVRVGDLSREIHALETDLLSRAVAADTVRQQLKAAKAREHTAHEHALLTKFFHQMEPTVCPRCTAKVTPERRAAEPDEHKCSVCTNDLNLDALEVNVVLSSSAEMAVASSILDAAAAATEHDGEDDDPAPRNEVDALGEALGNVEAVMTSLRDQITATTEERAAALAESEVGADLAKAAEERGALDLALARAEGAADAFGQPVTLADADPVDPVHLAVAEAAVKVLGEWVKGHQDPLLAKISADIERLTISFGGDSLSHIKLDGAANMYLRKGGDPEKYGAVTDGEKLRLKIATTIALIKHGYAENIGRHPGFLLLDSPAAEEMPEEDLATMVEALIAVAKEAPMQVIVATRNAGPLRDLLPARNRIIAEGNDYVW
jgi:hypothetical protein